METKILLTVAMVDIKPWKQHSTTPTRSIYKSAFKIIQELVCQAQTSRVSNWMAGSVRGVRPDLQHCPFSITGKQAKPVEVPSNTCAPPLQALCTSVTINSSSFVTRQSQHARCSTTSQKIMLMNERELSWPVHSGLWTTAAGTNTAVTYSEHKPSGLVYKQTRLSHIELCQNMFVMTYNSQHALHSNLSMPPAQSEC